MHMKLRNALTLFVAVALTATFAIGNQPTTQPGQPGRQGRERTGMPQNIEAAMKGANRAMRQLRAQITDASKKDENLKLIGDMQRNVVIAKNMPLPPDVREDVQGDARAKLQADYRSELIGVVRKLLDIEDDLMNGKGEDAAKVLDELQKERKAAHEKLGVHDDDDDGR